MTLLTLILAVVLLTALSWSVLALVDLLQSDGHHRHWAPRTPPRSHEPDVFEPRSPVHH